MQDLTVSQAGILVGRTPRTIHNWINSGRLRIRKDGPRRFVIPAEELPALATLAGGTFRAMADAAAHLEMILDDRIGQAAPELPHVWAAYKLLVTHRPENADGAARYLAQAACTAPHLFAVLAPLVARLREPYRG